MRFILLATLAAVSLLAADATGEWKGTLTIRKPDGTDKPGPAHLVLKQEGSKLTGTAGPNADEQHAIENGKAENGDITFELPTENAVMKFTLKQDGDEIKGGVTREREGQTDTAQLAVKREK